MKYISSAFCKINLNVKFKLISIINPQCIQFSSYFSSKCLKIIISWKIVSCSCMYGRWMLRAANLWANYYLEALLYSSIACVINVDCLSIRLSSCMLKMLNTQRVYMPASFVCGLGRNFFFFALPPHRNEHACQICVKC